MQPQNPYAPPVADVDDANREISDIDSLPVSQTWKDRFKVIARAGGAKLPHLKSLPASERRKASFNVLAFLFGPFYYAAKGMWKRGMALFAVCVLAVVILSLILEYFGYGSLSRSLGYGVSAIFAVRANIDYYKKMVIKDTGWW